MSAPTPNGRRQLLANLLLALSSLLLVALAAEGALRLLLGRGLNPFQPDPAIGYRLKRSFNGLYPRVAVRTDTHGRRVPADQREDSTGRFLFVGDSVTFGFSVLAEESFPHLVAADLSSGRDAANAAVPGYNLEQALAVLREQLEIATPEFVVYGLVVNDLGSAHRMSRYEDIDPHAARSHAGGLLSRSMLAAFVQRRWRRLESRLAPPEPEQTARQLIRNYDAELPSVAREAFDRQWTELEATQRRAGVPFYVVVCPFALQVHEQPDLDALQHFVARRCEDSNLHCLDPLPVFRARGDETLFTPGSSYHFTPTGHRLLADWLGERLGAR